MKYENFDQVVKIVASIEKHECKLNELDIDVQVDIIRWNTTFKIFSIEINDDVEYNKQASELVNFIRTDLRNRIDNLKSQLEQL